MIPELQTRVREAGDTATLFHEMVTAAIQTLNLEPQDATAISRATKEMAGDLGGVISDLTEQGADQGEIKRLQSLLQALQTAEDLAWRKAFNTPETRLVSRQDEPLV